MISKTLAASVFAALTIGASGGNAATMTSTSYGSFGVPQSGEFLGLDIYNHSTGTWLGEAGFAGDGLEDLRFGENPGGLQARFGGNSRDIGDDRVNFLVFTNGPSDITDFSKGLAINFAGQSTIGEDDIITNGMNGSGALYNSGMVGPLDLASTGVFGFMMEVYSGGLTCNEEVGEGCVRFVGEVQFQDEEGYGAPELVTRHFGFVELSRGSVIGGTYGVNTTNGQAVTIQNLSGPPSVAAVPLPASMFLLGAGLAGLGVASRRKPKSG